MDSSEKDEIDQWVEGAVIRSFAYKAEQQIRQKLNAATIVIEEQPVVVSATAQTLPTLISSQGPSKGGK